MAIKRTAVVLGATGLTGSFLLREMLDSSAWSHITVPARRTVDYNDPRVEVVTTNLDDLDDMAGAFSVDDVFCCLGTTIRQAGSKAAFRKVDYDYCLTAAKLAKQQEAGHFLIISAINSNRHSPFFYPKVKGELEDSVRALGLPALSIFHPSLLTGKRDNSRAVESIGETVMSIANPFLKGRLASARSVPASSLAKAMCCHAIAVGEGKPLVKTRKSGEWLLEYSDFMQYCNSPA